MDRIKVENFVFNENRLDSSQILDSKRKLKNKSAMKTIHRCMRFWRNWLRCRASSKQCLHHRQLPLKAKRISFCKWVKRVWIISRHLAATQSKVWPSWRRRSLWDCHTKKLTATIVAWTLWWWVSRVLSVKPLGTTAHSPRSERILHRLSRSKRIWKSRAQRQLILRRAAASKIWEQWHRQTACLRFLQWLVMISSIAPRQRSSLKTTATPRTSSTTSKMIRHFKYL